VFEHALAKDPERRYTSCAEFVADLRAAFDDAAGTTRVRAVPAAAVPVPVAARSSRHFPWLPVVLVLAALGAVGLIAALALGGGDGGQATATQRRPVVKTVTARGDTVTVTAPAPPPATVTAEPPTTAAAAPTTTAAPATTAAPTTNLSGSQLNDAGWQKMQAGDYAGASPLLEEAVQKLSGTGSLAEAYALYNLAFTRFALGSCDGVLEMLDQSQAIQGHRKEIDDLRKDAKKSCR